MDRFIKSARVVSLLLFISAAVELVLGGVSFLHTSKFIKTARKTSGKIVEFEKRESSSDEGPHAVYYPIYAFTDDSGVEHRITSNTGSYPPAFEVGESITVLYPPNRPQGAKIDSFWSLWLLPCVLGGMALIGMIAGLFALYLFPVIAGLFSGRPTTAAQSQA